MKQKKLPTIASLATLATVAVTPAWSAEEPSTEIGEITVTATRLATNLQDTPIAITAVTADALEERGITGVGELTSLVPNAQFRRTQGAFGPGVSASIRGVGQADTSLAVEPAVAFYLDDVYYRCCWAQLRPARHRSHRGIARSAGHLCSVATRLRVPSTSSAVSLPPTISRGGRK